MADGGAKDHAARRHALPPHPYRLHQFAELPPVLIGTDGRCDCSLGSPCPLRHRGEESRCTLEELHRADVEAVWRRAWQSGES